MAIILNYSVFKDGDYVCHYRQNAMCSRNHDKLLALEPLSAYTIKYMGSDDGNDEFEEDDETDGIRLDEWLKANTFAEGSKVRLRGMGGVSGNILTVGEGKWYQEYTVLLDSGEIVTVSQMGIRAPKLI